MEHRMDIQSVNVMHLIQLKKFLKYFLVKQLQPSWRSMIFSVTLVVALTNF
jgi:hypothetical protein